MRLLLSCICLIIINAVTSVHVSVCFLRIEGVSVILECKIVALYLDYLYALILSVMVRRIIKSKEGWVNVYYYLSIETRQAARDLVLRLHKLSSCMILVER